ncbi:hypothetical protein A7U60_g6659 [Sanghuangporus baumii]|uniref:VPS9 domain-containing protein n=1 Tax=Sanghuangporus baumii TaxID=108892 RepID=A0A9Q5NAF2_SANBA|nr:hypothetical protein A7U60_g6659 [Sanghuangporus baumii]
MPSNGTPSVDTDNRIISDPVNSSAPPRSSSSNGTGSSKPESITVLAQDSAAPSSVQYYAHGHDPDPPRQLASDEILEQFDPLANSSNQEPRHASGTEHPDVHLMNPKSPPSRAPSQANEAIASMSATSGPTSKAAIVEGSPAAESSSAAAVNASTTPASIGSGLSSLASFARSLTLPKVRTRSVDIAPPPNIITPNTISSFAEQQQSRPDTPVNASTRQPNTDGKESAVASAPVPTSEDGSTGTTITNGQKERLWQKDEAPPFDFQLFLDQMKSKSADPVAKYLRSFLSNFAKKSLAINEQIKVINEFLNFIALRMREVDVWKNATDAEFDNAMEAMEKLVMNRLYEFTFTPQLAEAQPPRPITTDDLERDRVLAQRIALFGWIEEKHIEVPDPADSGGFLMFAQQELLKINHYKAPRDKLICVLNCCKVIFGLIRHLHKEENADSFVPVLIFVVLKANPPNLISNIEYIQRFRNPQKLQSEAGYYLSSLMGAVQFIETMDHSSLSNITAEEFERNVEFAIHDLPSSPQPLEKPVPITPPLSSRPTTPARSSSLSAFSSLPSTPPRQSRAGQSTPTSPHAGEESAQPLAISLGGIGTSNLADDTRRFLQRTGDTISKPLNALGRLLGEALDGLDTAPPGAAAPAGRRETVELDTSSTPPIQTPYKPRVRNTPASGTSLGQTPNTAGSGWSTPDSRFSAASTPSRIAPGSYPMRSGGELGFGFGSSIPSHLSARLAEGEGVSRTPTPALDLAGVEAEIDQAHARAADAALGTLLQIFPAVDREVAEWVLEAEGGDLGRSIEKLLEIGGG